MNKNLFEPKSSYSYDEIISCGKGKLFGSGNAQLPLPPMLMFDRITSITANGGAYGKGEVVAEFDIKPELWFFTCHFEGDPVMPGCLGLDALWQLVGFFLGWTGASGRGRAFGAGEVKFTGMVTPESKLVKYFVDIKRIVNRQVAIAFADGQMVVDGEICYETKGLRVGTISTDK